MIPDNGRTTWRYIFQQLVFLLSICIPALASADLRDFIPRIWDRHLDLEIDAGSYVQRNEQEGVGSSTTTDTFALEKLRLIVTGYSYHPLFLQYYLNLAVGLREEKYSSTSRESPFQTGSAFDYDLRVSILPTHPYRLQLFARRGEALPTLTEAVAQPSSVYYSTGGIFTLKSKPYFLTAEVIRDTIDYQDRSSTTMLYDLTGTYQKDYSQNRRISVTADFSHVDGSSLSGSDTSSSTYKLRNELTYGNYELSSELDYNNGSQSGSSNDNDAVNWSENLSVQLPWNFTSYLNFNLNKSTLRSAGTGGQEDEMTNTSKTLDFQLSHRLYQSLTTVYQFSYLTNDSTGSQFGSSSSGNSQSWSNSLTLSYSKQIPYGLLLSGIGLSDSVNDTNGTLFVVNEAHTSVAVPGSFALSNNDINRGTIVVRLKSPVSPFDYVLLEENVNYLITPLGNTFQITVFDLPPPFVVPGIYDFYVSYALPQQADKTEITMFTYNLSFQLFNSLLIPYYNLSVQKQKVLEGSFEPNNSTINTVGLIINKLPFQFLGEYSNNDSSNYPYKTWRSTFQYAQPFGGSFHLYAQANYSHTIFGRPTNPAIMQPANQTVAGGSLSMTKRFISTNFYIGLTGAYSRAWSLTNSDAFSYDAYLQWYVGKAEIRLGARSSYLKNEAPEGTKKIDREYYYLNIKRNLF